MGYNAKVVGLLVGIFTLVVSVIMMGLSIASLLCYHCILAPDENEGSKIDNLYLVYRVYFYNPKCYEIDLRAVINWNGYTPSERIWAWSIGYLIINFFWFISSAILLYGTKFYQNGNGNGKGRRLSNPWLIVTLIVLCVDVMSTVVYAFDFSDLETFQEMSDFIQLNKGDENEIMSEQYFPLSSFVILAVFSKVVIMWIVTFAFFIMQLILQGTLDKKEDILELETRPNAEDMYAPTNLGYLKDQDEDMQNIDLDMELDFSELNRPNIPWQQQSNAWGQQFEELSPRSILKQIKKPHFEMDPRNTQQPWSYLPSDNAHNFSKSRDNFSYDPDPGNSNEPMHYVNKPPTTLVWSGRIYGEPSNSNPSQTKSKQNLYL